MSGYIRRIHKRHSDQALFGGMKEGRVRVVCTPRYWWGYAPDHVADDDAAVTCRPCIRQITGVLPPGPEVTALRDPKRETWCGLRLSRRAHGCLTRDVWNRRTHESSPPPFQTLDDLRAPEAKTRLLRLANMGRKTLREIDEEFFRVVGEHLGGMFKTRDDLRADRCPTCGHVLLVEGEERRAGTGGSGR